MMTVKELENQVQALPPDRLALFGEWFDAYREAALEEASAEVGGVALSEDQKAEVLRRRAAYLADPSLASPWEGTADRLIEQLRGRRQKAGACRG